jgi:hypothetical protein
MTSAGEGVSLGGEYPRHLHTNLMASEVTNTKQSYPCNDCEMLRIRQMAVRLSAQRTNQKHYFSVSGPHFLRLPTEKENMREMRFVVFMLIAIHAEGL